MTNKKYKNLERMSLGTIVKISASVCKAANRGNVFIFLFPFQEGMFEIDGLNGKITLKKPLDFEGSSSYYYLNITATVRTHLALGIYNLGQNKKEQLAPFPPKQ